jgi:iron complex transport system substrate-binding protein
MKTTTDHRIVSLLPSATEIACALGLGEQLVGITHCCDFPAKEIEGKPVVVHSALPVHEMELREIDVAVSARLHAGESLYLVDEELLRALAPTLLLTQDLCQVCAPAGNEVARALKALPEKPEVIWMSPHSLADIQSDIMTVGNATGRAREAQHLVSAMRGRIEQVRRRTAAIPDRPRIFCAEWLDPLYCSGHWVPEMVEIAGGCDPLGRKWKDSVRVAWEDVVAAEPDVIVVMACGLNCSEALEEMDWLQDQPGFHDLAAVRNGRFYAVDAGYFSRPGPRVVDGIELLADLLHPRGVRPSGLDIGVPFKAARGDARPP